MESFKELKLSARIFPSVKSLFEELQKVRDIKTAGEMVKFIET